MANGPVGLAGFMTSKNTEKFDGSCGPGGPDVRLHSSTPPLAQIRPFYRRAVPNCGFNDRVTDGDTHNAT